MIVVLLSRDNGPLSGLPAWQWHIIGHIIILNDVPMSTSHQWDLQSCMIQDGHMWAKTSNVPH